MHVKKGKEKRIVAGVYVIILTFSSDWEQLSPQQTHVCVCMCCRSCIYIAHFVLDSILCINSEHEAHPHILTINHRTLDL